MNADTQCNDCTRTQWDECSKRDNQPIPVLESMGLGYALGGIRIGDSGIHELEAQDIKALASYQVIFWMSARCGGRDAFGDAQEPRPVDAGTDKFQGTAEVIEIDGNGHVSAGFA